MPTKTFPASATLPVNTTSEANAGDLHLPIGRWAAGTGLSWVTRTLIKASLSFAGMTKITEARLYLYAHTAAGFHAKGSGTSYIEVRRKTADWSEASGGSTSTDEVWSGGASTGLVEGNMTDDGDARGVNADAADGSTVYVDVTETVRKWFQGSAPYGVVLLARDEGSSAGAFEGYSRRTSGRVPYFWIDYETNTPPSAPTGMAPSGGAIRHSGRTITYSGDFVDPDDGDSMQNGQIQLRTKSNANVIDDWTWSQSGGQSFSRTRTLPSGNYANRDYEWRARTKDEAGEWGAWSDWRTFRPNTIPNTPPAPTVETDTLTPMIGGTFDDPDPEGGGHEGNDPGYANIEVERVSPAADMWTSGDLSLTGSPWSKAYAGAALAWNTQYRARIRVADELGGLSAWSAWTTWTTISPVGPDNLTPRTTVAKVDTLTPTLTVGHSVAFRNDELEVYAGPTTGSTRLWSKPKEGADYAATTSKAYVYAGAALAWGAIYYWRARVEDAATGVDSAWSPLVPFRVNALPTASTVDVTNDAGDAAILSPADVLVTTDATPVLDAPFEDPDVDTDGDMASARSIEVRRKDTGAALAGYPQTDASSAPHTLTSPLTADVVYQARIGYRDDAGQPAGTFVYSAWRELKSSTAPTLTLVAPAMDATIVDSTPVLDWTYASAAGKPQTTFRVRIFDRGPTATPYADEVLVHDSDVHNGADTVYDVPIGVLADDHLYRWEVVVTDADGLVATLT